MDSPTQIIYEDKKTVYVVRPVVIRVISGPDQGAYHLLSTNRVRVGTASGMELKLSDPLVSRKHLEFQIRDKGYFVSDLESTNGTFYRGARVHQILVGQGAEIRLGSTVLRLDRSEEQSAIVQDKLQFGNLIGTSPPMQQVYGLLAAVAHTDTTVLLQGETGTGKEIVAEELHRHSPRKDNPFNIVDCGALPEQLIESELFGHEKGAFTGAIEDRMGVFERTQGGTVFLDEVSELPLDLQTRLLRVLDRRTIKRVGSNTLRTVDIRLVAATNRDLQQEVTAGNFRQDLFYRLAVVQIKLPPLRQRIEDIPALARYFLRQSGCPNPEHVLTDDVIKVLCSRKWPGNVRELRNVVERATVLVNSDNLFIEPEASQLTPPPSPDPALDPAVNPPPLPEPIADPPAAKSPEILPVPIEQMQLMDKDYKKAKETLLNQFEALFIGRMVGRHGVNITQIARDGRIDRHLVRKLLRKHCRSA